LTSNGNYQELIPFLTDRIDDEDEVLAVVASSLSKLIPFVGGQFHVRLLLAPLELLLSVEETTVRENAQKSALVISEALPSEHFHSEYTEMISRLAKKEWFTARISACFLIANSFHLFSNSDQEIKVNDFAEMCRDEVATVRRAAAQNLGTMLLKIVQVRGGQSVGPDGMLSTTFIPLYEELASSEQPDSVRLHTTENCISFGKGMTFLHQAKLKDALSIEAANVLLKKIVPLIAATIEDRSWRVRWTAASKFSNVIHAFKDLDDTFSMDILISAYEKLLQDPEAEVKTAAIMNLAEVAKCKSKVPSQSSPTTPRSSSESPVSSGSKVPRVSVAKRLVKRIQPLTEDDSNNVRAALAMVASDLAPLLGKESTINDLVPQILLLLRDTTSEVRLNVISSLGSLNEVIGVGLLSQSLLPAILDLASDSKWRYVWRLTYIFHGM
jgi:HEAT repeat.